MIREVSHVCVHPSKTREDVVLRVFLFLALAAILFSGAEPF